MSGNKLVLTLALGIILTANVSACGWFSYDDIKGTRAYYNAFDRLEYIEDSVLQMTRVPTPIEKQMNVYIPMNMGGKD